MTAANHSESNGGIKMAAGDMHRRGDEGRDGQTVRKRNREHVVSRRLDGADSNKNEGECADEFRDTGG